MGLIELKTLFKFIFANKTNVKVNRPYIPKAKGDLKKNTKIINAKDRHNLILGSNLCITESPALYVPITLSFTKIS